MAISDEDYRLRYWPNLSGNRFELKSPFDNSYNCVAFSVDDVNTWWDPVEDGYWPEGVPRELTVGSVASALGTRGYVQCGLDSTLEGGFEKVAIYARSAMDPTHTAKQLPDGRWKSKLGVEEDIEHIELNDLESKDNYGHVWLILKRPWSEEG